ncbi:hypothetical protein GUITHDRAFT_112478 [Guillardia theta CCMP2712]|uniref:SDA1 N-terminal domain-containing protein n=1 Tax=Guillardia theta (strain CCMP2712) TaxID=905079 RepID=L1J089_GUITC|nr:hypothetical protein GUITHDRAFT_112478 [Guillardia theta CCMP2712]EKX41505.1 hypothetical protein GUITHDRAFT_112478 [Guillardia theta CCMP2712]|eukprot:XP_005828485.1 hypothetical protein GUITHDRAFT_112478 [Guillardia theta CCMP2712]
MKPRTMSFQSVRSEVPGKEEAEDEYDVEKRTGAYDCLLGENVGKDHATFSPSVSWRWDSQLSPRALARSSNLTMQMSLIGSISPLALVLVACCVPTCTLRDYPVKENTCLLRLRGGKSTALGQRLQILHHHLKKDPEGYLPEVTSLMKKWNGFLAAWEEATGERHQELGELTIFLAHCTPKYHELLGDFPIQLLTIIDRNHTSMNSQLRIQFLQAATISGAQKAISVVEMCRVFFRMFYVPDKKVRTFLYANSLNAIKRLNAVKVNQEINRNLQRLLLPLLHGTDVRGGRIAIKMMVELHQRGMWNDAYAINMIGAACFSRQKSVRSAAIHFLLNSDVYNPEEDDFAGEEVVADDFGIHIPDEKEKRKRIKPTHLLLASKRKKKKLRKAFSEQHKEDMRIMREGRRKKKKINNGFTVIEQLHDPQSFAEKLLQMIKTWKTALKFDEKLLILDLLSRIMSVHQLILLDFYDFMSRFLQPSQEELHKVLAIIAQSVTSLTPPETISTLLKTIASNFIHDQSKMTSIAIGLNAIREICKRQPLGMDSDLLADLVDYNKEKEKSVVNAARSILKLFREVNPGLLRKKDRGKSFNKKGPPKYGEVRGQTRIDGIEILEDEDEEGGNGENDGGGEGKGRRGREARVYASAVCEFAEPVWSTKDEANSRHVQRSVSSEDIEFNTDIVDTYPSPSNFTFTVASFTKNLLEKAFGKKHVNVSLEHVRSERLKRIKESRFYSKALVTLDRKLNMSSSNNDNVFLFAKVGMKVREVWEEGEDRIGEITRLDPSRKTCDVRFSEGVSRGYPIGSRAHSLVYMGGTSEEEEEEEKKRKRKEEETKIERTDGAVSSLFNVMDCDAAEELISSDKSSEIVVDSDEPEEGDGDYLEESSGEDEEDEEDDEDEGENEEREPKVNSVKMKNKKIEARRILTPEDFEKIRTARGEQDDDFNTRLSGDALLAASRRKQTKAERMENCRTGRNNKKPKTIKRSRRNVDKTRRNTALYKITKQRRLEDRLRMESRRVNKEAERKRHKGHFHKLRRK